MKAPTLFAIALVLAIASTAISADSLATIDFSSAGYAGGGVAIPFVPAKVAVRPSGGDDTRQIQAALEEVARLPLDAQGFRGAVLLREGAFRVEGQLRIATAGVVLRGDHATLIAAGNSRRTLIELQGRTKPVVGPAIQVTDESAPAGAATITLANLDGVSPGRRILVRRPSNSEWIEAIGANKFPGPGQYKEMRLEWLPGSRDIEWERTVLAVDYATGKVTLDAPITTALETNFGGATARLLAWPDRLRNVGVENLTCVSEFDPGNPLDEEHAWMCVAIGDAENAWVRNVTARHFVSSCVWVSNTARAVTIADCGSLEPTSEIGGWRRLSFYVGGQQVLVQRCRAEDGGRDFTAGHCAAGPIVFLDCKAVRANGDSGPFESWASGVLYDRVSIAGAGLALANLGSRTQGAAWTAANCMLWNCAAASRINVENPPGAPNRAVVEPTGSSLYETQLAARAGAAALAVLAPTASAKDPANIPAARGPAPEPVAKKKHELSLNGGYFVTDGRALFGSWFESVIWKGQVIPGREREVGTSPTRWAPGRIGPGLTEDLDALTDSMLARQARFYWTCPGLWYDRRRDEHSILRREDAEVWAPFFEAPWARSGRGRAWDGLSQYDLTRFNPWYFSRLRELAEHCAAKGLVLVDELYCNHNLLEASAHWAEFAWRPANALQDTGFAEPPHYENVGQSRHHVADEFYDVSHPVRRHLHELYIHHTLDVLAENPNTIFTLGREFAGPLPFQQFFIDTVAAWGKAHGRRVVLVLETSKPITDAILADTERAAHIAAISTRWWRYTEDGKLFAPDGKGKRAFREIRNDTFGREKPVPTKEDFVYRIAREYRDRYPDKAIISATGGFGPLPVLMAGGAAPVSAAGDVSRARADVVRDEALLRFVSEHVADLLPTMRPADSFAPDAWCLANAAKSTALIYSRSGKTIALAQPLAADDGFWFNVETGEMQPAKFTTTTSISKPSSAAWLLLVCR